MSHAEEPEDRMAWIEPEVGPGSLLVSSTDLVEPAFRRTVIYMIEHNDAGSLGVVINRPSETTVQKVLPQWAPLAANPSALYVGGPVKRDSALCLGTARNGAIIDGVAGLRRVDGKVVMVDLDSDPNVIAPLVEGIRIFAGYSGWTVGQLDSELERDDWMVTASLPSDVVTPSRIDVWARVLRRQPLPLAMLATHPIEVERN
ncbi:YqgE/AlgH family protein [Rhodococcus sp. MS16]|uniref:YqgE/AlgH family protein n=1 Tax=Rhodococcus sp. MS16 TaxID=2579941 RepID=UPI0015628065|nr:YqgE/AlgH family protein [Rhodococcus sp. MS16]